MLEEWLSDVCILFIIVGSALSGTSSAADATVKRFLEFPAKTIPNHCECACTESTSLIHDLVTELYLGALTLISMSHSVFNSVR